MHTSHFFKRWPLSRGLLLLSGGAFYWLLLVHSAIVFDATLPLLAWLTAISCFLLCCWQLDREEGGTMPLALAWQKRDAFALLGVLLIGFALRTVYLDRIPLAMHNDEANMAMEAVHVLDGSLSDPFAVGWYSHPTLWFYWQSIGLRLFGETLIGVRALSVLIGTLALATTYFMARLLYGWRVAIVGAFLLATYHFHIHFSRIALNNIIDSALGPLLFSCLVIAVRTRRSFFYGLTGVVAGLSLYFYMGTRLFIVLLIVLGSVWLLVQRKNWSMWRQPAAWQPVMLMVAGFCFVASPILQTAFRDPSGFFVRTEVVTLTPTWVAERLNEKHWTLWQFLWNQVINPVLLFYNRSDVSDFYDHKRPLLQGGASVLLLIGLLYVCGRLRQPRYQILVIWLGLALFFGGILMRIPLNTARYVTVTPVVCILIALALDAIMRRAETFLPKRKILLQIVLTLTVFYLAFTSVRQYFFDYATRETFGNDSSEAATMLGRYLQTQPDGTQVWFMGNPWISYQGFPILSYYARKIVGHDLSEPIHRMSELPAREANLVNLYVAVPERIGELTLIQKARPGGEFQTIYWPQRTEPVLYLYRMLPHSDR